MAGFLLVPLQRWARRRRFPTLLKLTACVFALSVLVPDPVPLIDELLLGLATLTLAAWKRPAHKNPVPVPDPVPDPDPDPDPDPAQR